MSFCNKLIHVNILLFIRDRRKRKPASERAFLVIKLNKGWHNHKIQLKFLCLDFSFVNACFSHSAVSRITVIKINATQHLIYTWSQPTESMHGLTLKGFMTLEQSVHEITIYYGLHDLKCISQFSFYS